MRVGFWRGWGQEGGRTAGRAGGSATASMADEMELELQELQELAAKADVDMTGPEDSVRHLFRLQAAGALYV